MEKAGTEISDWDIAECLAEHLTQPCLPLCLEDLLKLAKQHLPEMRNPDAMIMAQDAIRFGEYYLDVLCRQYEQFLPIEKIH